MFLFFLFSFIVVVFVVVVVVFIAVGGEDGDIKEGDISVHTRHSYMFPPVPGLLARGPCRHDGMRNARTYARTRFRLAENMGNSGRLQVRE